MHLFIRIGETFRKELNQINKFSHPLYLPIVSGTSKSRKNRDSFFARATVLSRIYNRRMSLPQVSRSIRRSYHDQVTFIPTSKTHFLQLNPEDTATPNPI